METNIVVGYSNLAQETNWPVRRAKVLAMMKNTVRASVYLFAETDYAMASWLGTQMGWGKEGQPAWSTDENRNTVLFDRRKWYDVDRRQFSLSGKPGDLGDRNFRSVNWVRLRHLASGVECWFGASHLSNGDAASDRLAQAKVLAAKLPTGAALLLGVDRNSYETSSPSEWMVGHGLPLLTPSLGDTFVGDGVQTSKKAIDGLHGTVKIRAVETFINVAATDHRFIRAQVTI